MDELWELSKMLTELKNERRAVKNELRNFSEGSLLISKGAGGVSYFQVNYVDGKRIRKGIGRKEAQIYRLARKAYLEERLRRLDFNIRLVESCRNQVLDLSKTAVVNALPKNYSMLNSSRITNPEIVDLDNFVPHPVRDGSVKPIILPVRLSDYNRWGQPPVTPEEWFVLPYCENTSHLENKTHIAYNGLNTRSKSESLILEHYKENRVLYHYDETFVIDGHYVSPDIFALKPDNTFAIQEHAGLWSDNYIAHNRWKLDLYGSAGFVLGRNLLLTFDDEEGNINIKLIDALIEDMFRF